MPLVYKWNILFYQNLDKQAKQEKSYHELMQKSDGVKVNRFKVFLGGKETTGKSTLKQSLTKACDMYFTMILFNPSLGTIRIVVRSYVRFC